MHLVTIKNWEVNKIATDLNEIFVRWKKVVEGVERCKNRVTNESKKNSRQNV